MMMAKGNYQKQKVKKSQTWGLQNDLANQSSGWFGPFEDSSNPKEKYTIKEKYTMKMAV